MDPNSAMLGVSANNDDDNDDECILLEKDPNAPVEVLGMSANNGNDDDDDDDIVVVSEKGQVACRDYPHSRHHCIKFPFSSTPNQSHCNQCYCYVCDSLAPCVYWGNGSASTDHCHATDKEEFWKHERKNARKGGKPVQPVTQLLPVDIYTTAPAIVLANHTSATFQYPGVISQSRNNILASRNRLHPNLVSRLGHRAQQGYDKGYKVHRPVFKRTHPVRAATTTNQIPYNLDRGNMGNPIRQKNYQVNGMLSGSNKYLGSCVKSGKSRTACTRATSDSPASHNKQGSKHLGSCVKSGKSRTACTGATGDSPTSHNKQGSKYLGSCVKSGKSRKSRTACTGATSDSPTSHDKQGSKYLGSCVKSGKSRTGAKGGSPTSHNKQGRLGRPGEQPRDRYLRKIRKSHI